MPFLTLDKITFQYNRDGDPIINNLSLSVKRGQKIAIKADSGRGKTTLLRLILGFIYPDSGEIRFDGMSISEDNFEAIRNSTAWLPQDLNLGDGSVAEVIERIFNFSLNRSQKPETSQIKDNLTALHLPESVIQKQFRDLSTGQRQRVGLAICHMLDRPLLLLDEPTSALDKTSKQKAADLLFADPNRTVMSTTHDPFWLDRCDAVYSLD